MFGEDVGLPGGPYGASRGLHDEFGDRVFDTPISESAILGAGIGVGDLRHAADRRDHVRRLLLRRLRPGDQPGRERPLRLERRRSCPITIRSQQGPTPGSCAQHSQCIEAILAHIPGIRVGVPAFADDAFQMLRAAIASDDPVIVLESRALYPRPGRCGWMRRSSTVGRSRRLREGGDVTVVSWGRRCTTASTRRSSCAGEGVEVDLIDLRWLNPLDFDAVLRVGRAHEQARGRPRGERDRRVRRRDRRPGGRARASGRSTRRSAGSGSPTSACRRPRRCRPSCSSTAQGGRGGARGGRGGMTCRLDSHERDRARHPRARRDRRARRSPRSRGSSGSPTGSPDGPGRAARATPPET